MNRNEYNGWTNRATWLVNVWFNPESVEDVDSIKDRVEEEWNNLSGFFKDMIDIDDINWKELRDHFEDEEGDEDEE